MAEGDDHRTVIAPQAVDEQRAPDTEDRRSEERLRHHQATFEAIALTADRCTLVWTRRRPSSGPALLRFGPPARSRLGAAHLSPLRSFGLRTLPRRLPGDDRRSRHDRTGAPDAHVVRVRRRCRGHPPPRADLLRQRPHRPAPAAPVRSGASRARRSPDWFTAESFGGPDRFSRDLGFDHLISVHRGLEVTEAQRRRFVELYMTALDDAEMPTDLEFREAVREHVEFGSRVAMHHVHRGTCRRGCSSSSLSDPARRPRPRRAPGPGVPLASPQSCQVPTRRSRRRTGSWPDSSSIYELDGDSLTIWGGEKGSPAYFRGTFDPEGRRLRGSWVWPGGGYDATMTRTD